MKESNKENNKRNSIEKTNNNEEAKYDDSKIIINTKLDLNKIPLTAILHENLFNFKGAYFKKLYEDAENEEKKGFENEYGIKDEVILLKSIKSNDISKNDNDDDKNSKQFKKEETEEKEENLLSKEAKKEIKKKKVTKIVNKNSKSDNQIKGTKHNKLLNNNPKNKSLTKNHIFKIDKIIFEIKYDTQIGENISVIGSINKLGDWDTALRLNLNWNEGNIWNGSFDYEEVNDFEYKFIIVDNGCVKEWEFGINRKFIFQQIKSLIEPNLANGNIIILKNIMNQNLEYDYNNYSLKIVSERNKK